MIEVSNISKSFEDIKAVDNISIQINEGYVFGLVGTNGAGKSTFLRMLGGVLKPDAGDITIDDMKVYENEKAKSLVFFLPDDQYFLPSGTPEDMIRFYERIYPEFRSPRCRELLEKFGLEKNRRIATYSKGMKKQLGILLGICAGTKYLLCDETFDGLDPVMRQAVKSLFAAEMADREFTPVIASHNLRELEDICDHVGLLHKGGVLLSRDLEEMKHEIHKVQIVYRHPEDETAAEEGLSVISREKRGSLVTLSVRGEQDEIVNRLSSADPIFIEALPLSLEEIFISETGACGYDIKKLIF